MGKREVVLVQKYAQSFVERVENRDDIWDVCDDIQRLLDIIHETKLDGILNSSTVSPEEKEGFVRTLRQSRYRFVNELIELILEEEQADLLSAILEEILLRISKQKNEFDATVASVYPLTEEQKERIRVLVENRFRVRVRNIIEEIDKELLGGFVVTVNHRVIDTSVRAQLKDIRSKL